MKKNLTVSYDSYGSYQLDAVELMAVAGGDVTVFYDGRNLGDSNFCPGFTAEAPLSARVNVNCHQRTYDDQTTPDGVNVRCRTNAGGLNPICYSNLACG